MVTPIDNLSSQAILIPEGGSNFSNAPPRHQLKRNTKLSVLFKFIQLLIAVACLVLFSSGGQLFTDATRTAVTYGTYGAYVLIPMFLIAGFVIGEETPILLVGYNLFGAVLFAFVGFIGVDSWWSVRMDLQHVSIANLSVIEHLNDVKLLSAILSVINAVFYAADTIIEGVILHDFYRRV
ncbi:hypothetical protein L798_00321 [Zootermopsis nevadensis]|uniref:MARVEL domain-containing protein n=2 Tax=Zootermopsis nevadensis TaxID=136037 RepID=A0A067QKH3_ZOONE|nr:hypothetical protein L798_00321 [Zootermopsis nevadensis]